MKKENICINCAEPGSHFVPPSLGDIGFYAYKPKGICKNCNGEGVVENSTRAISMGYSKEINCPTCKIKEIINKNSELQYPPDGFSDKKDDTNYWNDAYKDFWAETGLDTDAEDLAIIVAWFDERRNKNENK